MAEEVVPIKGRRAEAQEDGRKVGRVSIDDDEILGNGRGIRIRWSKREIRIQL